MAWDKPKSGSVNCQVDGGDFKPDSSKGGCVGVHRSMSRTRVECRKDSTCSSAICIALIHPQGIYHQHKLTFE